MANATPKHILSGPVPVIRDLTGIPKAEYTLGERIIRFIETFCIVPEGEHVGKAVTLAAFQKELILAIYDNKHVTDTAILSIARKNAKTGTIAFLVIAHLLGPVAKQNSRIVSGAMSREQAAEVYNLASKCLLMSDKLRPLVKIIPSSKTIIGNMMNVTYKAISSEGKTAHGLSPIVAILDEVGQITGPQSDFVDAITTAQGAYENPLLIYISTQAPNDADLFSVQIDDAKQNKPPKTVCHVYAADAEASVMDEKAWYDANPALGLFRSKDDVLKQAEKAMRMPSFENTFRNLILNQRVSTSSPFVSRNVWEANGGEPDSLSDLEVYGGLDLSARTDLTALVLSGRDKNGILHVHTFAWTPKEGLHDRAKRDRVPYDVWVKKGFLKTTPGHTVDYDFVVKDIMDIISGLNIKAISFDRWRIDVFKKSCEAIGVELPLLPHGQGFKDMSPALDILEADLLNSRIRHGMHPVLTMCAGNAVVSKDPAGNRKLDKAKATGRIDCMVALAMSEGAAMGEDQERKPDYQMFFI